MFNLHLGPRKQRKKEGRAQLHNKTGPSTSIEATQADAATDQRRAVARRASQGAVAPWVCPLPQLAHSAQLWSVATYRLTYVGCVKVLPRFNEPKRWF
jgi:hypothetical protein